jgi:FtsH-binding integral membrane protein
MSKQSLTRMLLPACMYLMYARPCTSFGLIFLVYGVIQLLQLTGVLPAGFLPHSDALYGMVGATLFSFYLAYHTKIIVGGKHTKYQMNDKDYVFGASTLFL